MEGHHTIDIRRIQLEAEKSLENFLKVQEETLKMSLLEQEEELLAAQVEELLKRKEEDEGSMAQFKEEVDRRMVAVCDEHKFQLEFQNKKYDEEAKALMLLRDEREYCRDFEVDEAMQTLKSHLRSEHDTLLREAVNNQQISHEVRRIVIVVIIILIINVIVMTIAMIMISKRQIIRHIFFCLA